MKLNTFRSKIKESIFSYFLKEDPILEEYDNVGLMIRIPSGLHILTIDNGLKVNILHSDSTIF